MLLVLSVFSTELTRGSRNRRGHRRNITVFCKERAKVEEQSFKFCHWVQSVNLIASSVVVISYLYQ